MNLRLNIREATRALAANRLRSVLTMLGVIFGVGAVVVMVAIGAGTRLEIRRQIEQLGVGTLVVTPLSLRRTGADTARPHLTDRDALLIEAETWDAVAVAPFLRGQAQLVGPSGNWSTTIIGTTQSYLTARDWSLDSGRGLNADDLAMNRRVLVLGQTTASRLFGPGEDPVGRTVRVNQTTVRVVGLMAPKGQTLDGTDLDDTALMPLPVVRNQITGRSAGRASEVHSILIRVPPDVALDGPMAQISALLRQSHALGDRPDDFLVREMSDYLRMQEQANSSLTILLAAVASISLLIGGVGIMNIMLVSVTERTREIGIRAAVGATPADILSQFLVEAVLLSALGALIGLALAVGSGVMLSAMAGMTIVFQLESFALAAGFAAIVGVVFGFYPALKAARLPPLEALRR